MLLAFAGVVGLWGIGFFSFDLISSVLDKTFRAQGLAESEIAGRKTVWTGITSLLQNLGAFFGIYAFTYLTAITGRRKAFAVAFLAAMGTTAFAFWNLKDFSDIFWMIPLMGLRATGAIRRLCDLSAGVVPDAPAQHGYFVLLQRGTLRRRAGSAGVGVAHQPHVRRQA
jgi:hypothetical protein